MSQYIVFRTGQQEFAVSILATSRIMPLTAVTPFPDTADYIMGVMESEQQVLPVIDLPNRFFNGKLENKQTTQVIVVYWNEQEVGIAVDEVVAITNFTEEQMDRDLEKITSLDKASEVTPIDSFIRTEEGIILELNVNELFDMEGSLQIQELIDSYI